MIGMTGFEPASPAPEAEAFADALCASRLRYIPMAFMWGVQLETLSGAVRITSDPSSFVKTLPDQFHLKRNAPLESVMQKISFQP